MADCGCGDGNKSFIEKFLETLGFGEEIEKKADKTYVDEQDELKADKTYVDIELNKKAGLSYTNEELAKRIEEVEHDGSLVGKGTTEDPLKIASGDGHIHENKEIIDDLSKDAIGKLIFMGQEVSDGHSHNNNPILDKLGESEEGKLTYNGNDADTVIAQRDVYDGIDSDNNTISLAASVGKFLWEAITLKLNTVEHDETLSGSGTEDDPLKVSNEYSHTHDNKAVLDLLDVDEMEGTLRFNGSPVHRDADYKTIGIYPTVADLPTEAELNDIALVGSISDYVGGGSSSLQHFLMVEKTDPDGNTHDVWEDIEYHRLPAATQLGEIKAKIVTNADGGKDLYISIDGTDIDAQDA